jgi:hypothetical protein
MALFILARAVEFVTSPAMILTAGEWVQACAVRAMSGR